MPFNRREFLLGSGLSLLLVGCDFVGGCYGVSCQRIDSVGWWLIENRSRRRKNEVQAPFSLAQMRQLDFTNREKVYFNLLRQTFNSPLSVFTPADGSHLGFPQDEASLNQSPSPVIDPAEIVRYGLILKDLLNPKSPSLSLETPFSCVSQLYFYLTEPTYRNPAVASELYDLQKKTASQLGYRLMLLLANQEDLGIYGDNCWVLAASWLPVLGSFEAQIQTGSEYELAAWLEDGYVGVVR